MLELPASLIERLKQFSAEHNATVFMTLLACFQILLSRYSGQTDVAVGSPIANRTQSAVESIIGSFVNTLVLRTDLSGNPTFLEVLARVRATALEAYAHQDFPFDKLVETLHSSRDHSSAPLVQVLFNVPNAPIGEIHVHGLSWVPFEVETQAAQFDLSLTIETEFSRKAYLTFNTDLFELQTAQRMLGQYRVLLQSALAHPQSRLSELPTLTVDERRQMVQEWNHTQRAYPQAECVPQLFEAQVEQTPEAVAVSMGQQSLRYGALNARANQLARYLQTRGAKPGVTVGLSLERSLEMVIALLAVLKTGAAYVPLDPEFPRERLRFMAQDASVTAVLTTTDLSDRFDARTGPVLCLDREHERIAQEADHNLGPIATPLDLAYILYTSGSTGQPKGVEIPHRALVNFLWSIRHEPGCTAQDVLLSVTTISFDIFGLELYMPLLTGARVEIAGRAVAMDGRHLRSLCEAVQPTIMQATPATWRMLIEAGWSGSAQLTVLCGGEALPPDLATSLLDRSRAVWNMYGPTETTIWSTVEKLARTEREITIGKPIANTNIYILDQFLQPVPIGVSISNPDVLGLYVQSDDTIFCYSGTLGCRCVDSVGTQYVLSNLHVMGGIYLNEDGEPSLASPIILFASTGDDIVQPATGDSTCSLITADVIAKDLQQRPAMVGEDRVPDFRHQLRERGDRVGRRQVLVRVGREPGGEVTDLLAFEIDDLQGLPFLHFHGPCLAGRDDHFSHSSP